MKKFTCVILVGFLFLSVSAQISRGKISVIVINEQQSALENANVELLRSKDSGLVKIAITDKNGISRI